MENTLKIPFESLLNRGVRTKDPFKESFFQDIYRQAFTLVDVICQSSEKSRSAKSLKLDEIQNVIAFTGRRGTGKTSVMLTLVNHLVGINQLECVSSAEYKNLENSLFYNLPPTDASVLETNEDLFLIVLSKMFKLLKDQFQHIDKRYDEKVYNKQTNLRERICKLYDHYVSLKGNDDFNIKSSYNLMEKLSDKYNVRDEFREIVAEYTDFLVEQDSRRGKLAGYILICIDDIDMSHKKHMQIMQCIHQYFMTPNVIVFTTLSFPMISAALQKDFYSSFSLFNTINEKDEYHFHLSFEQTNDFMRKIISSDMRITMPSWRKKDYKELSPAVITFEDKKKILDSFGQLKESVLFAKLDSENNYILSPKGLIMLMLVNRTKIYLDVDGNKMHFMEPDSLRNLCDMFYMLYHMNNIVPYEAAKGNDGNPYFAYRRANRKILLDYLNFKMLPQNDFPEDINALIREFLAEPIERRGKRIWDYYFKCLENSKEKIINVYGDDFYEEEKSKFRIENYSFGELFRVLYYASRLEIIDRNLIKFVLASFSFSLPQFVETEKWKNSSINPSHAHNDYRRMRDIFEYTLLGTWNRDLFNDKKIDAVIYVDTLKQKLLEKDKITENLVDFFKQLIYILLLSSRSTRNEFNVGLHCKNSYDADSSKQELQESDRDYYYIEADIDPTAFIMNSLRLDDRMKGMKFKFNDKSYTFHSVTTSRTGEEQEEKIYAISDLLANIFRDGNFNECKITYDSYRMFNRKCDEVDNEDKMKEVIKAYNLNVEDFKRYFKIKNVRELRSNVKKEANKLPLSPEQLPLFINDCFKTALENIKNDKNFTRIYSDDYEVRNPNTLWFFLKHMDISYNVIKRAVSRMIYNSDNNLKDKKHPHKKPYHVIETFYGLVDEFLSKEDKVYFPNGENDQNSFSKSFSSHPIVNLFYEKGNTKKYSDFSKYGCGIESGIDEKVGKQYLITLGEFFNTMSSNRDIMFLRSFFNYDLHKTVDRWQLEQITILIQKYYHDNYIIRSSDDSKSAKKFEELTKDIREILNHHFPKYYSADAKNEENNHGTP